MRGPSAGSRSSGSRGRSGPGTPTGPVQADGAPQPAQNRSPASSGVPHAAQAVGAFAVPHDRQNLSVGLSGRPHVLHGSVPAGPPVEAGFTGVGVGGIRVSGGGRVSTGCRGRGGRGGRAGAIRCSRPGVRGLGVGGPLPGRSGTRVAPPGCSMRSRSPPRGGSSGTGIRPGSWRAGEPGPRPPMRSRGPGRRGCRGASSAGGRTWAPGGGRHGTGGRGRRGEEEGRPFRPLGDEELVRPTGRPGRVVKSRRRSARRRRRSRLGDVDVGSGPLQRGRLGARELEEVVPTGRRHAPVTPRRPNAGGRRSWR